MKILGCESEGDVVDVRIGGLKPQAHGVVLKARSIAVVPMEYVSRLITVNGHRIGQMIAVDLAPPGIAQLRAQSAAHIGIDPNFRRLRVEVRRKEPAVWRRARSAWSANNRSMTSG